MEFIDLKSQQQLIKNDLDQRMSKVLAHGQYIMGPEVAEVEAELARFLGIKHAITCASGTDALLMSFMALDLKPGDEIITTAFTFYASVGMMVYWGVKPVLVDIDPKTFNLDLSQIEKKITSKTKVIMPVSLFGQCVDMTALAEIARKHNLVVLEDAAQSFGAKQKGKFSCNLSPISCTSFFPAKPLGIYGDGGACFTSDDAIAHELKSIRVHGSLERYNHTRVGLNGRFDTIQAAVLQSKLRIFPRECEDRELRGRLYNELFKKYAPEVQTPVTSDGNSHVYAQYTIRVKNRESVIAHLKSKNIPAVVHYPKTVNQQKVFQSLYGNSESFPQAEKAAAEVLSLPMHPYLKAEEQQYVVEQVAVAIRG
jgi:UDP-2-acetamido-2-deoxy-ribo-hexuluronate aminotransferase